MAKSILNTERSEYTRAFGGFRGVDLSSEQHAVESGRFTYLTNMWRDYESGQGDAVETVPGYRCLAQFEGRINGIFRYRTREGQDYVVVHAGTQLHRFLHKDRDNISGNVKTFDGMEDAPSTAFIFADKLYMLDGMNYYRLDGDKLERVTDVAYIPCTYVDGVEYEQRNMLTDRTREVTSALKDAYPNNKDAAKRCVNCYDNYSLDWEECKKRIVCAEYVQVFGKSNQLSSVDFSGLKRLKTVYICLEGENDLTLHASIFNGCDSLTSVFLFAAATADGKIDMDDDSLLPSGTTVYRGENQEWNQAVQKENYLITDQGLTDSYLFVTLFGKTQRVVAVRVGDEEISFDVEFEGIKEGDKEVFYARKVMLNGGWSGKKIEVEIVCEPSTFQNEDIKSEEKFLDFFTAHPEYEGTTQDAINHCTVQCQFDGRLFFTGNPVLPNTVFYTQRDLTGYNNPTYVGLLNYMNDGVGNTPNTAMVAASGMLMVFKSDTAQDGSVYYHTGQDTGSDLVPRIYPSTPGVPGVGCLGAAVNFYDDVCFLSRRGLEAIGKQTVNLERTVEHRSSNVDKLLTAENLSQARFAEWKGYLVILCGQRAYLADSRQIFTHSTGVNQYEFYYMDDLCSFAETVPVYAGTEQLPYVSVKVGDEDELVSLGEFRFPSGEVLQAIGDGERIDVDAEPTRSGKIGYTAGEGVEHSVFVHYIERDGKLYYVEATGEVEGVGEPSPASAIEAVDDVLYIGMEDGTLVCMNTDKRGIPYVLGKDAQGQEILAEVDSDQIYRLWYTHAGRRYLSGFATAMDNAGYPHLLKSTVKKSMVLKMKTLSGGGFRVMSRTNDTAWRQVQRSGGTIAQVITSDVRSFADVDFARTGYDGTGGITVPIMEKEKKWVEKQLYLYSDEYAQPFGIFSLAYRFYIAGRIKK